MSGQNRVGIRGLALRGTLAIVLSVLTNLLILRVVLTGNVVEPFDALSIPPVTLLSMLGAAGATVVYGAVQRFATNPNRTFVRIALIVLVLSFIPDIALLFFDPAATLPAVVVLMVMHVTVAMISVGLVVDVFSLFENERSQ